MDQNIVIPISGMLTAIIIVSVVFIWLYLEEKGKREAIIEISKHLNDPRKLEELLGIFEDRKKEPLDYRRGGVIALFVGAGLYLLGYIYFGRLLEGVGALVAMIGIGQIIAGYLYPNTGSELTNAVEKFEEV
ncbi:DUF6249 domain-containing protein [Bacteroidota bacterium]|jgi:hypothetical protein|nr:DUF6249 domain-containing protein [Balneolaceae bacterium]MDC3136527.1 DUF6249 domain-containing protein [Bacteroidota bacterium]